MINQMVMLFKEMLRGAGVSEEKGQTLIEYALIVALISIAVIAILLLVAPELRTVFQGIVDALSGAAGGGEVVE